jgi:hypothetical protein
MLNLELRSLPVVIAVLWNVYRWNFLVDRVYEREAQAGEQIEPFTRWLQARCAQLGNADSTAKQDLIAIAGGPSRMACSFKSMSSHGSHYRVEGEEDTPDHVTFDCGVAELELGCEGCSPPDTVGVVHIKRVGTLKDILVLNYANMNVVVMVVSWVAAGTELQPRLRRDPHGFWLANMDAPRCHNDPYILPSLASQVLNVVPGIFLHVSPSHTENSTVCELTNHVVRTCRCSLCPTGRTLAGVLC